METKTIKSLFNQNTEKHFVVPKYQRAYSWEEKQLSQFLEDLKECETYDYHLGHFLFEQDEHNINRWYVIDGQQRLTTCVIFFSALIELLKQKEKISPNQQQTEKIDDLIKCYLKSNSNIKFITVDYDNNFFFNTIINHDPITLKSDSKSQELILNALNYFKNQLKNTPIDQLYTLAHVLENASITTYIIKNKLQAMQIFNYQNDRGKKLSNLEILKVYFMLQICRLSNNQDDLHYI